MSDPSAVLVFELDGREDFRLFKLFAFSRAGWALGIDAVFYVADEEPEEFRLPDAGFMVERVDSIDDVTDLFQDHRIVVIEKGGEPLARFEHPERALYVFGGDLGTGLPHREDADRVSIPSRNSMYAHQAATIVAHDRFSRLFP